MSRLAALAVGIAIFTEILFLTPGCLKKSNPAAPPCDGFNGGSIVGKWRFRFFYPDTDLREYRADGTYRVEMKGQAPIDGTYEVDGNLVRTQHPLGNGTASGEECFDVKGSVLWMKGKNAAKDNSGYYDRI
ncbi:MAG: hypothetical protein A2V83_04600 [Nitrospirae bacterium RBG_16_64_22]|nr:MAG: hypothetical protein A2V83_04600 [Nitrospirae bacterium RBG_16_64_22]